MSSHGPLHRLGNKHKWRCYYCGRRTLCGLCHPKFPRQFAATRDHYVPKSQGGRGGDNLVLACFDCNHHKADYFHHPRPKREREPGCYANPKSKRPRKAFRTMALAQAMCDAVFGEYGKVIAPYLCDKCLQWHVSAPREARADLCST